MSVVGIDLGNLNAVIAAARQGGIEVLTNEYTYRLTPTMISMGAKQRFIGEAARPQQTTNFKNTITQFKRLLGRQYADPEIQEELASAVFRHEALPDGRIGIKVNYRGEDAVFTPEQMLAMFMTQMKVIAERNLHKPVVDVVVSCPNWFNDFQRRAIERACSYAGLKCVRVFNDTTASALAYGIYKQDMPETDPRYVAFVDMGHSSLQVAVVGFVKGKLTVKATSADRNLGGRDFDNVLYEHFRKEFLEKHKIDLNEKPRSRIRLLTECEKLKKLMSANTAPLPINVECLTDEHDFHSRLSREDFEAMSKDILGRIEPTIQRCVAASGIPIDQIESVEVIGGSTRVPAVKDIIQQVFKKEVSTTLNADEAVARGCALQAAIVSPTFRVREIKIEDTTPYAVDLLWVDPKGEQQRQTVFEANGGIPSTKQLKFKRSEPFEMALEYHDPAEVPGQPQLITRYRVDGVKPDAEGEPVSVKIQVRCSPSGTVAMESATATEEYMVEVVEDAPAPAPAPAEGAPPAEGEKMETDAAAEAADQAGTMDTDKPAEPVKTMKKQTKKTALPIVPVGGITDAEMNKYHELETQMTQEDRMEHDRVDAKNALEEYVYESRDKLDGALSEYVSEADKEEISARLTAAEDWLYDEGEDVQKSLYVEKLDHLKAMVVPIHARSQEWQALPAAEEALRTSLVRFRKVADQARAKDEKYEHLTAEDIAKLDEECNKVDSWLNAETAKNQQKNKTENPSVTVAQINETRMALERTCNPIALKPKPKPATPPPEPAASEPAPEAKDVPMAEPEPAVAEEEAKPGMDID